MFFAKQTDVIPSKNRLVSLVVSPIPRNHHSGCVATAALRRHRETLEEVAGPGRVLDVYLQ